MTTKQFITRIIVVSLSLAACCGLVVLLVAAIGKKKHDTCEDFVINIKGSQNNSTAAFIDEKDVKQLLMKVQNGKIKGQAINSLDLRKLEQKLKDNPWIKNAELYFDNQDVLHVSVKEREPIARIFTARGNSFYIDEEEKQIPLSGKMSARVPVFTSFPDKPRLSDKDSLLLDDVKKTATFILKNPFWMAQVEQVDIAECSKGSGSRCWGFEMVPTVGNHVVRLGHGDEIEKKFHRLMLFYQQVLTKTGFDKYDVIDVQFTGQVIGSKNQRTKVDSLQMQKNIQKLLHQLEQMQKDTTPVTIEKPNIDLEQQAAPQTSIAKSQLTKSKSHE
jgi:cell division protein FtsQ